MSDRSASADDAPADAQSAHAAEPDEPDVDSNPPPAEEPSPFEVPIVDIRLRESEPPEADAPR